MAAAHHVAPAESGAEPVPSRARALLLPDAPARVECPNFGGEQASYPAAVAPGQIVHPLAVMLEDRSLRVVLQEDVCFRKGERIALLKL
jgi:hypothetical protein